MFSPDQFLQTVYSEANDTKIIPCPVGEWPGQCSDVKVRSGTISKGDRQGETWASLNLIWDISDPSVTAVTQRTPTRVTQSLMLDLTPEGNLDMGPGKNVQLGRAREACGLNVPGQPFGPQMFVGRTARVNVAHRIDERDSQTILQDVKGVTKL